MLWWLVWSVLSVFPVWLVGYAVLNLAVPWLLGAQDLKKKYNAEWALVTGASSGIGKSLATELLKFGLNVVLVAQPDDVLAQTARELQGRFPALKVRQCGVDLSDGTGAWMQAIVDATKDVDVQIVFNNAGYILTGFFEHNTAEQQLRNFHCNATAAIHIAHHFYAKMVEKSLRGTIVFTSSASGYFPAPFACMYGTSKAALSAFAASLAVEAWAKGIHVHAMHPSPVRSRFLSGGGNKVSVAKLEMFDRAYKMAVEPDQLPAHFFSHIGRPSLWADIGGTAVAMRVLVGLLGYNLLTVGFALFAPLMPDYKANLRKKDQGKKRQ